MLKKFLSEKCGNIAVTTAIALMPIVAAVGASIDYSQICRHTSSLQQALDAAALGAAKKLGATTSIDELRAYSKKLFLANIKHLNHADVKFQFDEGNKVDGTTIVLQAKYSYPMVFGKVLSVDKFELNVESMVKSSDSTFEIALVLDNSGSMRYKRIASAKLAATSLVKQLHSAMKSNNHNEPVRFSLVPFAGHVNVGARNANAEWMDTTGISPIHHENLNWADNPRAISQNNGTWKDANGKWLTRFSLYGDMRNVSWKGCVESRPYPYFTNDQPANRINPETMFVPIFAPDEPDNYSGKKEQVENHSTIAGKNVGGLYCYYRDPKRSRCKKWNDGYLGNHHNTGVVPNLNRKLYASNGKRKLHRNNTPYGGWEWQGVLKNPTTQIVNGRSIKEESYHNNYLNDDNNMPGGMLPREPGHTGKGAAQNRRQDWSWKYLNQSPNTTNSWKGPNAGCSSTEITPLTANKGTVLAAIAKMGANGSTNIPLGISWGWRTLTSGAPLKQGRPANAADNSKIMIIMTDGNNSYYTPSSIGRGSDFNKSTYGTYGYTKSTSVYKHGRLFEAFDEEKYPAHNNANFQAAMNEHMLEICANAENDGVSIHTVAFDVPKGSSVKTMLQSCASVNAKTGAKQYFNASGSAQLLAAFEAIGNDISNLRLAQ